jgi:hypothetical protein
MTPAEAQAIVNQIGNEAITLMEKVQGQGDFTERDGAMLIDLQARYVDFLDMLIDNPLPIHEIVDLDELASYMETK